MQLVGRHNGFIFRQYTVSKKCRSLHVVSKLVTRKKEYSYVKTEALHIPWFQTASSRSIICVKSRRLVSDLRLGQAFISWRLLIKKKLASYTTRLANYWWWRRRTWNGNLWQGLNCCIFELFDLGMRLWLSQARRSMLITRTTVNVNNKDGRQC